MSVKENIMGIFSIFKSKTRNSEKCMFRDLLYIAYINDSSNFSEKSKNFLASLTNPPYNFNIKNALMKKDPSQIKDCYPSDPNSIDLFFTAMIQFWLITGENASIINKKTTKDYITKVAKKLGYSERDIADRFDKFEAISIDPMYKINLGEFTGQFMEFKLLDDWKSVLLKMLHLGMISESDFKEQENAYKAKTKDEFSFTTTINELKHIKEITFETYKGKLCLIGIELKVEDGEDMNQLKQSLLTDYSKIFGKPKRIMIGYMFGELVGAHISLGLDFDSVNIGISHILLD